MTLLAVTCVLLVVSLIGGDYLEDQAGQNAPTILALLLLMFVARNGSLSDVSMIAIIAFVWLHILGARYVYSDVPYDDWATLVWGKSITETFHFRRNHYDRVVHFAYGLLATPPQTEFLRRRLRTSLFWTHLLSITIVTATGALYEIFEWGLAVLCAPDFADHYNGQQGDMWDSQKDMALNILGAATASIAMMVFRRPTHSRDE